MVSFKDRVYGSIFGLVVGDALGAPVEFKARGSFDPIVDYISCDQWNLPAGSWTDDTSMTLALMDSITFSNGIDPKNQLQCYVDWYLHGFYSVNGKCFDIGDTTRLALDNFIHTNDIRSPYSDKAFSGNGSLMRHLPVPLFTFQFRDPRLMIRASDITSSTTHSSKPCCDSCYEFSEIIWHILCGLSKTVSFNGNIPEFDEKNVISSGYVVDTLELAKWCFITTNSFEECVLKAVNYGGDADTLAAVSGALAGCYYGFPSIPDRFLKGLAKPDYIMQYTDCFYEICSVRLKDESV